MAKYTSLAIQILCFALILSIFSTLYRFQGYGLDMKPTCGCLAAIEHGLDPYHQENVRQFADTRLSCTYQGAIFYLFKPVCGWNSKAFLLFGIPAISALLSFLIFGFNLLVLVVTLGGFSGVLAMSFTANIASFAEFLLFGGFWWLMRRRNLSPAAAFLGLAASIKYVPIAFVATLIGWGKRPILIALGTLTLFLAVAWSIHPQWFFEQFLSLAGQIPGNPHSVRSESDSGGGNPTLLLVIKDLLVYYSPWQSAPLLLFITASLAWIGYQLYVGVKRHGLPTEMSDLALWTMFIFLLLPRTKPYFLAIVIFPFIELLRQLTRAQTAFILLVAVLYPAITFRDREFDGDNRTVMELFENNYAIFSILFSLLFVLWFMRQNRRHLAPASTP